MGNEAHFEYNADKLLVSAQNGNGRVYIVYNPVNKLPMEVRYSSGYTLYYGYNSRNLRTFLADNHGYNISYIYDAKYRLVEVRKSNDSSLITRYEYTGSVVSRKILGNGAYSVNTYDGHKLVQMDNYFPNHTLSSSNRYDYDLKGRVTRLTDSSGESWNYKYDITGQLIGWTSSSGEDVQFTYDNRGNKILTQRGTAFERYSVNEMNQYTSYNGNEEFSYDPNGNLVRKVTPRGIESYAFDAEGKLISTETPNDR